MSEEPSGLRRSPRPARAFLPTARSLLVLRFSDFGVGCTLWKTCATDSCDDDGDILLSAGEFDRDAQKGLRALARGDGRGLKE